MKKIAFLVMAHKNADQVKRLIDRLLSDDRVEVFLHFDKKYTGDLSELMNDDRIHFLAERLSGHLYGQSLVEIENRLLTDALCFSKTHTHLYYYCLLSGQDYLLKPITDIVDELLETYPKPYIDCTPRSDNNWLSRRERFSTWYVKCNDNVLVYSNVTKFGIVRKIIKAPFYFVNILTWPFMNITKKLKANNMELYGGGQWWILPDDIVEYLVNQYVTKTDHYKAAKSINGPDETYYQTMIMNSDYRGRIDVNRPDMVKQNSKTFPYFKAEGRPVTGHPYVFTYDNIDFLSDLSQIGYFFARKFDAAIDSTVLDLIDKELLGIQ